jgi:uncharacterized membrane-anchored protein YhcB (DUF1043 family)
LVGTKHDLSSKRQVSVDEAKGFAAKLNMKYVEVSAKDGTHVQSLFHGLAQDMHDSYQHLVKKNTSSLVPYKPSFKSKIKQIFASSKTKSKCSH